MKADLHAHGAIGFQDDWLKRQGYSGKNLLQLFVDACLNKNIDICAVASEEFEIFPGSVHDRFSRLARFIREMPHGYSVGFLGKNLFSIVRDEDGRSVYFVNSQSVIVNELGNRMQHLVIGSNQIPQSHGLERTIKYCDDRGLIQIAENPLLVQNFGMGEENFLRYRQYFDAVMAHDAQLVVPAVFGLASRLWGYSERVNEEQKAFAGNFNVPWIAVSNAHRIKDIGDAFIQIDDPDINMESEEGFFSSLKSVLRNGVFAPYEGYSPFFGVLRWNLLLMRGLNKSPG